MGSKERPTVCSRTTRRTPRPVSRCLGVTGNIEWFETAQSLLDRILEQFVADGSYFDTAADAEELVWRPQDPTDNASPSGVSLAAEAFTTLASLTGSVRYETAAQQALTASAAIAARAPRFAGRALAVAETIASGPLEIAIVGESPELSADSTAAKRPGVRRSSTVPGSRRTADGRPWSGR